MIYSLDFFNQFKRQGHFFEENNQHIIYTFPNGFEASVIQPCAQMELIETLSHAEHEERELSILSNGKMDLDAGRDIGLKRSTTKLHNDVQLLELLTKIYTLPKATENKNYG